MKRIFILLLLIGSSTIFAGDRFLTDAEKTQELLTEMNDNLVRLNIKLDDINSNQKYLTNVINFIYQIAKQYEVEEWSNTGIQAGITPSIP